MTNLDDRIADLCGAPVRAMARVSGGDVADAFRVTLADGRTVFAKTKADAPEDFFSTEAAGLRWLGEAGVASIPEVIGVSDDAPPCLVLEWIEPGATQDAQGEQRFGTELAALHQNGAPHFGRPDAMPTGSLRVPNEPSDTWADFYAAQRLRPLAEIAAERNSLSTTAINGLVDVADRLGEFDDDVPASRLHGDLWSGNRIVDVDGRSWLIDPAAHGGHREFDLGMMRLFGGFSQECFDAYDEVYPLNAGWQERIPLHHLAPLAVHAIKFGGPYAAAVDGALAKLA